MMSGVGWGAAAENLDRTVRTSQALERITQQPPLAVIPRLPGPDHDAEIRRRRALWVAGGVAGVIGLLVAIAAWWMPLDVLWFAARRKAGF
jgi:ferric-dicitrate binding protein FerR (iron transport regulator)